MIDTIAHLSLWRRAVTWLAFAGLLSNFALPAAISMAVGSVGFSICTATSPGDLPGKTKPNVRGHHCALCAAPAAVLPGPNPGAPLSHAFPKRTHPQPRTISLAASPRHGRVQARAPPFVA
jgi:hypothetical protein